MKTKKIVSLFLAVLMACSVFAGLSVVSADDATAKTYTVTGDSAFLSNKWAPDSEDAVADDMTLQEDGTYKKTYENVAKADLYTVKVAENHSWVNSFGPDATTENGNVEFSVPSDGATVDIILTLTGTREKTLEDGSVVTQDAGYVTVLVNGTTAPEKVVPLETEHYVAGQAGLCNGIAWKQDAPENKMTKMEDGSYEITFTGVNPKEAPEFEGDNVGTYQFKVTTNGAWEPAYDYAGVIAPGGGNAEVPVTEANSTVKLVLTKDLMVKAYVNGVDVTPAVEPTTEKPTETTNDKGETSAVTSLGGYYTPAEGVETKRFFFEMPADWYTFSNATPVAYWWDGTDKCGDWQHSKMLRPAYVEGRDIWYIDVPTDVPTIIFGNGIDGGAKPAEGEQPSPNWGKNYQTGNIGAEYYDAGESETYPTGVETFDNMVYVIDPEKKTVNDYSGATEYGGEWFYLHKDGTVDTNTNITEDKSDYYEIKGIQVALDKNSVEVVKGKTTTLKATIKNADPSLESTLTWTSSNLAVATVDENGVVTAVEEGTANITVTVTQGEDSYSTTAAVTVLPVPVSSVKLSKTATTVIVGKTTTLKATVAPSNAAVKTVKWTSTNSKVAAVSSKGVVKGVKVGTAYVRATATDGSKKYGQCKVTVAPQKVTKVSLSKTAIKIFNGKTYTLRASVAPSNATNKTVKWTTTNSKVATVTSRGVVKGVRPGTAYVKATAVDGSKKYAQCRVTVSAQKVTKVALNKYSASLAKKGAYTTIKATVSPSNAYNKYILVSNSNKSVVKVYSSKIASGKTVKVVAQKRGSATIKFTAADGSKKYATCKVTVRK